MPDLPYAVFDADNHYYEAEDAFTRHMDPKLAKRAMQWADVGGRRTLLVAGKVNRFIPNPTFDPVAKPGCLDEYFRGRNPGGRNIREIYVIRRVRVPFRVGRRCSGVQPRDPTRSRDGLDPFGCRAPAPPGQAGGLSAPYISVPLCGHFLFAARCLAATGIANPL